MKRLGIMLSAITLLTSAAHAADLGWNSSASPIYSPTPASGWSGFYAGVDGGWARGWSEWSDPLAGSSRARSSGGLVGGHLGYNWQIEPEEVELINS